MFIVYILHICLMKDIVLSFESIIIHPDCMTDIAHAFFISLKISEILYRIGARVYYIEEKKVMDFINHRFKFYINCISRLSFAINNNNFIYEKETNSNNIKHE